MNVSCTRLVTGASDNQLRLWALDIGDESGTAEGKEVPNGQQTSGGAAAEGEEHLVAAYMGSVVRQGNGEFKLAIWHLGSLQSFPSQKDGDGLYACLVSNAQASVQ